MAEDLIGLKLGPYRIVEYLGGDALTEVYQGHHAEDGHPVVIKIVGRQLDADPVFSTRFRREAKAIASLQHPNIVRVYDFGQAEGGHYVVMDFVEGVSLADLMVEVRAGERYLEPDDIVFIIRQIASALDHAHRQGVVHRAVSPATIILTRSGQAILADFGLSLLASRGDGEETPAGTFGAPEYMAPELLADPRAASPTSDIYSLGVILYELLTGERPFELDSDIDLALRDLAETAPDPRLLDPDIPRAVAEVALKALATSPRERFPGAMKFATALERAYQHGASPVPVSTPGRHADRQGRDDGELPAATRPTAERVVVHRGLSSQEARRERRRLREENRRLRREERLAARGKDPATARRRPLRSAVIVLVLVLIVGTSALVLETLGLITVSLDGVRLGGPERSEVVALADDTPTPAPAATAIPTPTIPPAPTPLQMAEATPVPALAFAALEVGASAFRLPDGAVIQFVPAGTFLMGTDQAASRFDSRPQHPVMLSDYWIDQTEVTNARYALCVESGLCPPPADRRFFDSPNFANHPVSYVRHTSAVSYCLWLAGETGLPVGLPTEAQWEKAAIWDPLSGESRRFPWGSTPPSDDLVRYGSSTVQGTAPAGTYPEGASAYGALDMAGNVWEWVADWYDEAAYQRSGIGTDPTGPATGTRRVTRGGGWYNLEPLLIGTVRNWVTPTSAGPDLGFRCATNARRPLPEDGVFLTPLDLTRAFAALVDAAYNQPGSDQSTLDEWHTALEMLEIALDQAQTDTALVLIDDRLVRLTIHRSTGMLAPDLALRLDGGFQWMRARIAPGGDE